MPTLTGSELDILHRGTQHSSLALSIFTPSTVLTATVDGDQTRGKNKPALTVTSGSIENVVVGMTALIGTAAGKYDIGKLRVRSIDAAVTFAEHSLAWTNGWHVTILKDWIVWPVYHKVAVEGDDLNVTQDGSVAYSDQNADPDPVVVMGCAYAGDLRDGSPVQVYYDGSESWSPDGATISSYAWTFEGGSPSSSSSATPGYVSYSTAGHYWTYLTVTDNQGKSFTGRRQVIVHNAANPPITGFELRNLVGDYNTGGWEAEVVVHENLALTTYRDGAFVVLWGKHWYGHQRQEFGRIIGRKHVMFVGWIDGDSVSRVPFTNTATFKIKGIVPWMGALTSFPVTLEYSGSPSKWWEFPGLNLDRAVWFFLRWSTTALVLADFNKSGNTLLAKYLDFEGENVTNSVDTATYQRGAFLKFASDQYGRMYLDEEVQIHSGTVPYVVNMSDAFWREEELFVHQPRHNLAWCELSGVYFDGSEPDPVISMAPGDAPLVEGGQETVGNLVVPPQNTLNIWAGRYLGWKNNPFPELSIPMAGNWAGVFDVIPQEAVRVSLNGTETRRGFTMTDQGFVVRNVSHRWDGRNILTDLRCEMLTDGTTGVDGRYPEDPPPEEDDCQPCEPCHENYPCDPDPDDDGPLRRRVWVATRDMVYFVTGVEEPEAGDVQPNCYACDNDLPTTGVLAAFAVDPFDPEGYVFCHFGGRGQDGATTPRAILYLSKADDPDHPWLRPWRILVSEEKIMEIIANDGFDNNPGFTNSIDWQVDYTLRQQSGLVLDINQRGKLYFMVNTWRKAGDDLQRGHVVVISFEIDEETGLLNLVEASASEEIEEFDGQTQRLSLGDLVVGAFNPTKTGSWATPNKMIGACWVLGTNQGDPDVSVAVLENNYSHTNGFEVAGSFGGAAGEDPEGYSHKIDPNNPSRVFFWNTPGTGGANQKFYIRNGGTLEMTRTGVDTAPAQVSVTEDSFDLKPPSLFADEALGMFLGWRPEPDMDAQKIRFFTHDSNLWMKSDDGGDTWSSVSPSGAVAENINVDNEDDIQAWGVVAVQDAQNKYYAGKRGIGPNYVGGNSSDPAGPRDHVFAISTDDGVTWVDRSGYDGTDDDDYPVVRITGQLINIVPVWTDTDT